MKLIDVHCTCIHEKKEEIVVNTGGLRLSPHLSGKSQGNVMDF